MGLNFIFTFPDIKFHELLAPKFNLVQIAIIFHGNNLYIRICHKKIIHILFKITTFGEKIDTSFRNLIVVVEKSTLRFAT